MVFARALGAIFATRFVATVALFFDGLGFVALVALGRAREVAAFFAAKQPLCLAPAIASHQVRGI